MDYSKKLSIIIPVYNTEKYLRRCLNSVLYQTYKNIEVIIVNDGSTDNSKAIIQSYKFIDSRIKYIEHEVNKGAFLTRIDGIKEATSEFITFLDSDDYVSIDFYRTLMINIQENNSDIAMGKTIFENENGERHIVNLFDCKHHFVLKDEEIFENFLKQKGLSYDWFLIWNKVYRKEIWDKALLYYNENNEHYIINDDLCYSVVLFYFAKKLTFTQNDGYFYYENESFSTRNIRGYKQLKKIIDDVKRSLDFMEKFLIKVDKYEKYKEIYMEWRMLYKEVCSTKLSLCELSAEENNKIEQLLNSLYKGKTNAEYNAIYSIQSEWNDGLERIKNAINDENIKCVSFDLFDTLVQRPFINPTDLFEFMNNYFVSLYNNQIGINFKKIRMYGEELARERIKKKYANYQDVTIDEIYETIADTYYIEKDILEKLKNKEKELEIRFCTKRKTGYELYTLALALDKKVIITSDMYLDKETIIKILEKNDYNKTENIYLSSEIRLTKAQGNLYKYILKEEKIKSESIIHVGDNYLSDVSMAMHIGIKAMQLKKAYDVAIDRDCVNDLLGMFLTNIPSWKDNANAMNFLGIRCMIAVFVNNYFDNPYITFNLESDFNSDPYLIGYFALGFFMFGVTKWLLEDTKKEGYEKLIFMARDGYLPMQTYKIMKRIYENVPNEEYLYISRKALIPVLIRSKLDFYKLSETVNVWESTPNEIIKYIKDCIKIDNEKLEKICRENKIDLNKKFENISNFNYFIKIIINNFFDQKLINKNQEKLKEYFLDKFKGKSAIFDVGYSARPELYLSQLCEKPLDTYFFNTNEDVAYMHSKIGKFNLKTFFDGKPAITGFTYETLVSALSPSCIGYDFKSGNIEPIFEKYNKTYQEEFIIGIMQNASIQFVQDMVDIFDEDIDILFFEKYYVSLPIMAYFNSSRQIDRKMFDGVLFEDDLGIKDLKSFSFLVEREMAWKNQIELHKILDIIYEL